MGHLALLAAAGALALFSWGWLDRLLDTIWPWYEPRTEQIEESPAPEPSVSPASESDELEGELRDLDAELDELFEEGVRELDDVGTDI